MMDEKSVPAASWRVSARRANNNYVGLAQAISAEQRHAGPCSDIVNAWCVGRGDSLRFSACELGLLLQPQYRPVRRFASAMLRYSRLSQRRQGGKQADHEAGEPCHGARDDGDAHENQDYTGDRPGVGAPPAKLLLWRLRLLTQSVLARKGNANPAEYTLR